MITIYAEKPDVGNKIAAVLDCITLKNGKKITFKDLKANEKVVKAQQAKDGFLKINYLGEECYVTWGYGHLCELKQAADYDSDYKNWAKMPMPFIPTNYELKVKDNVKQQYKIVKDFFAKSSMIINATDDDREGDLIFDYVYRTTRCKKPFKRVHMASQTEEGIKDAFAHLLNSSDVKNRTDAGNGRSDADAIVGWNITAKMTLQNGGKNILSYGRVQTPTLNILVKREKEILNFKKSKYYTINAEFETLNKEKYKGIHSKKKFDKKEDAEDVIRKIGNEKGIVKDINKTKSFRAAPDLFNLSALQMEANSKYGFTLAKTLDIAQKLYEAGYTTYPRTNSRFLTEDMEPTINIVLNELNKDPNYSKYINGRPRTINFNKYFNNKKVTSHYAIIPTKNVPTNLSSDHQKIYDLIAKSVIMMIYGPAEIEKTQLTTDVKGELFESTGTVILKQGWLEVDPCLNEDVLPDLNNGDIVSGKYSLEEKETKPPKRYTDKTLVSAMISAGKDLEDDELKKILSSGEGGGIGTEATRAAIVETLIGRGYVERNGKNIVATSKGIAAIDALPIEDIKSAELTAKWEQRLKNIEDGKESLTSFLKDIELQTKIWVDEIGSSVNKNSVSQSANVIGTCPQCGKNIVKTKWGYGCLGYKEGCKFGIGEIAGKKLTESQVKQLLTKGVTNQISGFKSKSGKLFNAKLKLTDEYKVVFDFPETSKEDNRSKNTNSDTKFICPKCGHQIQKTKWAYKCPDCDFSVSLKIAGKNITDNIVKTLLEKNETEILSGFISKSNKSFNAKLALDENKKIIFKFE